MTSKLNWTCPGITQTIERIFRDELYPRYEFYIGESQNMAKIKYMYKKLPDGSTRTLFDRDITPEKLSAILADEFKLDLRDISCERIDVAKYIGEIKGSNPPKCFLIPIVLKGFYSTRIAYDFILRALALQGIAPVNAQFAMYWAHNTQFHLNETKTLCPRCSSRLRVKEQRRKDHILVTITCPNRPWCHWGSTRVVPLTGPRQALGLSVDHGDDLEAIDKSASLGPLMERAPCPRTLETQKNPEPHLAPTGLAIQTKNTGMDPKDWRTWPVGSKVTHDNGYAGPYTLREYSPDTNSWLVFDSNGNSHNFSIPDAVRFLSGPDEHNVIYKKNTNRPIPAVGMAIVSVGTLQDNEVPVGTIGYISEIRPGTVTVEYKFGDEYYVRNWSARLNDPPNECYTFWDDNCPLDQYIKNEWNKLGDELLGGMKLRAMKEEPNSYWNVGEEWIISSHNAPDGCVLILNDQETQCNLTIGTICANFIPVSP